MLYLLYRLAAWWVRQYSAAENRKRVTIRQYKDGMMKESRLIYAYPADHIEVYGEFRCNHIFYDVTTWTGNQ